MRSIFTKFLTLIVSCLVGFSLGAQDINTLIFNAPAGNAGSYEVIRAGFGSASNTEITANAAFANDGSAMPYQSCAAPTNDLTGLVGFVDRGACSFVIKAKFLQEKGAIAVVICQNAPVWPFVAGGTDATITVPTFTLSQADCTKLRGDIISGMANVTLKFVAPVCEPEYNDEAFWGKVPGQGDFDGGLGDWTIENYEPTLMDRQTWYHSPTGGVQRAVSFSDNIIQSSSNCNGAAVLDLFAIQAIDNPDLVQPYQVYRADLISPIIDCSGRENVLIEFTMIHNRLNGNARISFFDGTNWSTPSIIPSNNTVNSSARTEKVTLPVPQFADNPNAQVRFNVEGDFYHFVLDDVALIDKSIVDMRVNRDWVSVSPSLRVPKDQVSEIPLLADIENVGNTAATGTVLEVIIFDNDEKEIARLSNNYDVVDGGFLAENKPFADTYTPPKVPGFYFGEYIVSAENEDDLKANNNMEFFFEITEKTFGNLLPEAIVGVDYFEDVTGSWAVGSTITSYYSAGNVYYVVNGEDYTVENVRFGLENDINNIDLSGVIILDLYEWKDLNSDRGSTMDERILVGRNFVLLDKGEIPNPRNIQAPIFAVDAAGDPSETGEKVVLKDNTTYFLVAHTSPFSEETERYRLLQYSGNGLDEFDRSIYPPATNFAFDTLKIDRRAGSLWDRAGTDGSYENIAQRSYFRLGNESLLAHAILYLEMDLVKTSGTYDISNDIKVSVFPNPAVRDLFVDITLENVSKDVKVEIFSIDGSLVVNKTFNNIQDDRLRLDVSGIAAGTYTVLIKTEEGVVSRKVVVQK